MPPKTLLYSLLIAAALALAGCSSDRPPLSATLEIKITPDGGCQPNTFRTPAAEMVTLKLDNQAGAPYTWAIMGRPVTPPFDGGDAANVFYSQQVPARATSTTRFRTPAAAGIYQVLCSPSGAIGDEDAGQITVVRP